jgi:hypothetical protein
MQRNYVLIAILDSLPVLTFYIVEKITATEKFQLSFGCPPYDILKVIFLILDTVETLGGIDENSYP